MTKVYILITVGPSTNIEGLGVYASEEDAKSAQAEAYKADMYHNMEYEIEEHEIMSKPSALTMDDVLKRKREMEFLGINTDDFMNDFNFIFGPNKAWDDGPIDLTAKKGAIGSRGETFADYED